MFGWSGAPSLSQASDADRTVNELSAKVNQLERVIAGLTGTGMPALADGSVGGNARQVIDTMRRDLGAQRKMFEDFYLKSEPLLSQVQSLSDELKTLRRDSGPTALKTQFVTQERFAEVCTDIKLEMKTTRLALSGGQEYVDDDVMQQTVATAVANALRGLPPKANGQSMASDAALLALKEEFYARLSELRRDLGSNHFVVHQSQLEVKLNEIKQEVEEKVQSLHDALEHSALKSGYLAVAVADCSQQERLALFETLRNKERSVAESLRKTANNRQLSSIGSTFDDMIASARGQSPYPSPVPATTQAPIASASTASARLLPGEQVVRIQRRPGTRLGLSLNAADGNKLYIDKIGEDSEINFWNTNNPAQALKAGDQVIAINGVRGDPTSLINEAGRTDITDLSFTIMRNKPRPMEYSVKVTTKDNVKLGLSLDCEDKETLIIKAIAPGLIQAYNDGLGDTNFGTRVLPGDRIVAINNKRGDPHAILQETQNPDKQIEIKIVRDA